MIKRTVSLVILLSLLIYAVAGTSGCGKTNSLVRIFLLPTTPVFAKGTMYQLSATALFSDGLTVASWIVVTWRSSDPNVATVSSTGVVSGINTGTAVITATDMGHPGIRDSVTVSVTELSSISITPPDPIISAGTSTQFTATGEYTAQTPSAWSTSTTWPRVDLTSQVFWESSSTTVATIGNILGLQGLATAGSTTGTSTITATDLATRITGTAILTVVP